MQHFTVTIWQLYMSEYVTTCLYIIWVTSFRAHQYPVMTGYCQPSILEIKQFAGLSGPSLRGANKSR